MGMETARQTGAFSHVLENIPPPLRGFAGAALQVGALEHLYAAASESNGGTLAQSVLSQLEIKICARPEDLAHVPVGGTAVVAANHPFGMLDGLVLNAVLEGVRPDFKIVVNEMLDGISELRDRFITVDVFGGRDAIRRNAAALREAVQWLRGGHLLVVFPSGEVSHWQSQQRGIADPPWNTLAARCAIIADAPVIPAFFTGDNSFVFQIAGFVHPWLRTARLPAELLNKRGRTIEVRFGAAVSPRDLAQCGSLPRATSYLRARTYMLGRRQLNVSAPRPAFLPFRPRYGSHR